MQRIGRRLVTLDAVLLTALHLRAGRGCVRTLTRWGQQVFGIASHRTGESTVKDVVFEMDDGSVISREYEDISPFEAEPTILAHDGKPSRQADCTPL